VRGAWTTQVKQMVRDARIASRVTAITCAVHGTHAGRPAQKFSRL
jgi:hypothetical protein